MNKREQLGPVEKLETLPKIRAFLETETNTARSEGQKPYAKHQVGRTKALEEALADFDKGDYRKTAAVLEKYHGVFRTRADHETDIEGIPALDNARANEIAAWIDILNELPETGQ